MRISYSPRPIIAIAVISGFLIAAHLVIGDLILTGDEPRYLYASVSSWINGNLNLPRKEYETWLSWNGLSHQEVGSGIHSVIHAIALGPIIGEFGLTAGRWAQLIIGLAASSIFIIRYEPELKLDVAVWLLLFMVSLPILPYLKLIYSEIWLFSILLVILTFCSSRRLSRGSVYIVLFLILILPFIHLRAAFVALILAVYLLYRVKCESSTGWLDRIFIIVFSLFSVGIFAWYQNLISGGVSASAPYSPSFSILADRLVVHLLGYRHGLLLYAPVAVVGIAGLILGSLNGNRFIFLCFMVFVVYVASFIWGAASESYTARFWVFIMPTIIIGCIHWWRLCITRWKWAIVSPLVLILFLNTSYFIMDSGSYLANRFGPTSYDNMFYKSGSLFHFGMLSVNEPFELYLIQYSESHNLVVLLCIGVFIAVFSLFSLQKKCLRMSLGFVIILMYAAVLKHTHISFISSDAAHRVVDIDEFGRTVIKFVFDNEYHIRGVKIGKYSDVPLWGIESTYPKKFLISGMSADGSLLDPLPAPGLQMFQVDSGIKLSTITITADDERSNADWVELDINLFY